MGKKHRSVEATSAADQDKPAPSVRFNSLPERIRPEDMTTAQETEPARDPEMGPVTAASERPAFHFLLRQARGNGGRTR